MDWIPGPRRKKYPHRQIPYLCGRGGFPSPDDYNLDETPDEFIPGSLTFLSDPGAIMTMPEAFHVIHDRAKEQTERLEKGMSWESMTMQGRIGSLVR